MEVIQVMTEQSIKSSKFIDIEKAFDKDWNDGRASKTMVDWKDYIIRPILDALSDRHGFTILTTDLRSFGLRAHVPIEMEREGQKYYIDLDHTFGNSVRVNLFRKSKRAIYPPGSIGDMNGFDGEYEGFDVSNKTPEDVALYVFENRDLFKLK